MTLRFIIHLLGCIVVIGEYGSVSEKLTSEKDPSAFKDASTFVLPQCMVEPISGSNKFVISTDEKEADYPTYEIVFSPKNPTDAPTIHSKLNLGMGSRKVNVESIRH